MVLRDTEGTGSGARRAAIVLLSLATVAMAGVLLAAIEAMPELGTGLLSEVHARMPSSGVGNPVTAVLLNFRAYDTLLEMVVLFLAVLGVFVLGPRPIGVVGAVPTPMIRGLVHLMLPSMIVVAGYLLWVGADAPGGAFQGAAILAGAGVLALCRGLPILAWRSERRLRGALVAGVATFLTIGITMIIAGRGFLDLPASSAGAWILVIETAAMLSISLTLGVLFVGGHPRGPAGSAKRHPDSEAPAPGAES